MSYHASLGGLVSHALVALMGKRMASRSEKLDGEVTERPGWSGPEVATKKACTPPYLEPRCHHCSYLAPSSRSSEYK